LEAEHPTARLARMTAPAVCCRVRAVEGVLGVSLFERRGTGMRLTEAGRQLPASAERALRELAQAAETAREAGTASPGGVVICTHFSASIGRFRDALLRFVQLHRRVDIEMVEGCRLPDEAVRVPGRCLIDGALAELSLVLCSWSELGPVGSLLGSTTAAPGPKRRRADGYAIRRTMPEKLNLHSGLEGHGAERKSPAKSFRIPSEGGGRRFGSFRVRHSPFA
jgi:DNA-binding transcriptional LysR family regulator